MKTIQVRWARYAGHCWRSRDELISDILLWTPSHGQAKAGQPARTYIQQLCANTEYSLEDLQGAMDNREGWRETVREIHADGTAWWWWHQTIWLSKDRQTISFQLVILIIINKRHALTTLWWLIRQGFRWDTQTSKVIQISYTFY